jgi:branched-subunit amino acid aminotransferase/4-amino-4-deoxychorismate lyase
VVGTSLEERALTHADLSRATELFFTGTTAEVLPVVSIDEQKIGDGRPGPMTRRLQEGYEKAVHAFRDGRST